MTEIEMGSPGGESEQLIPGKSGTLDSGNAKMRAKRTPGKSPAGQKASAGKDKAKSKDDESLQKLFKGE